MANFAVTHYVALTSASIDGTTSLSWAGSAVQPSIGTVIDNAPVGVLNLSDTFSQFSFSGFYIEISGAFFGVFRFGTQTSGTLLVPYNNTINNIGPIFPSGAGTTTLYDATLENAANCFLTGTRIATPEGERAIETLQPGDLVLTSDGTATPVLWVWQQTITNVFGLGEARAPIRVARDALGPGCPARDLIVTADHALVVGDLLINAGALVNGTSIRPVPLGAMPARFTYWHLETEAHVALIAEGCPAESFVDYTDRRAYDNHAAYLERYGADRLIPEMALIRISTQRLLPPALRARLGIGRAA